LKRFKHLFKRTGNTLASANSVHIICRSSGTAVAFVQIDLVHAKIKFDTTVFNNFSVSRVFFKKTLNWNFKWRYTIETKFKV